MEASKRIGRAFLLAAALALVSGPFVPGGAAAHQAEKPSKSVHLRGLAGCSGAWVALVELSPDGAEVGDFFRLGIDNEGTDPGSDGLGDRDHGDCVDPADGCAGSYRIGIRTTFLPEPDPASGFTAGALVLAALSIRRAGASRERPEDARSGRTFSVLSDARE